jgi:hypothetical protein
MGSFGNGFVFMVAPTWRAIADAFPRSMGFRGYRHRREPLWLLDVWAASRYEHTPFTDRLPEDVLLGSPGASRTKNTLATANSIFAALAPDSEPYGLGWLGLAARVSVLAQTAVFFFAADDDETDMACTASGGILTRFRIRFSGCAVEYGSSQFTVTPLAFRTDPARDLSPEVLARVARLSGVTVKAARMIDGGLPPYQSAVRLWPDGDPAAILGIGTWEPFQHVARDFAVAFEQIPAPVATQIVATASAADGRGSDDSPKRWWQFWR